MEKTGRNQACPCGSGKKYKRCCLAKDQAARSAEQRQAQAARDQQSSVPVTLEWDDDGLDQASNAVVHLIHAGKLDEAEVAARELLERYPEVVDGYDRLGMVAEARGLHKEAADYYRQAAALIEQNPDGFDEESIAYFRDRANQLDPSGSA